MQKWAQQNLYTMYKLGVHKIISQKVCTQKRLPVYKKVDNIVK